MQVFPPTLDLNQLKLEMNISDASIQVCGFSPDDLQNIYADYLKRYDELEDIKNEFISKYIVAAKGVRFHSYGGRVKHPYHLIEKIIRKRSNNSTKYQNMTKYDYFMYITDLIGCRILLVYKDEWEPVHDYLTSAFRGEYIDSNHYYDSYKDAKQPYSFMAERPVVHMRLGDEEIYPEQKISVKRDKYYRSLHYVVRYGQYYIEIQVRTLFDEAWGEVDHDVLYPYYKEDPMLIDFSKLINRASGMGDEMSTYFKKKLSKGRPPITGKLMDVPGVVSRSSNMPTGVSLTGATVPCKPSGSSSDSILNSILYRKEV